jgi:pimeloyl-ACP methyl ester carboxylesterase
MDKVVVNGLEIAYQRSGSGPPLVLLHGGFGDSRHWSRQLDRLSDECTVLPGTPPAAVGPPIRPTPSAPPTTATV